MNNIVKNNVENKRVPTRIREERIDLFHFTTHDRSNLSNNL